MLFVHRVQHMFLISAGPKGVSQVDCSTSSIPEAILHIYLNHLLHNVFNIYIYVYVYRWKKISERKKEKWWLADCQMPTCMIFWVLRGLKAFRNSKTSYILFYILFLSCPLLSPARFRQSWILYCDNCNCHNYSKRQSIIFFSVYLFILHLFGFFFQKIRHVISCESSATYTRWCGRRFI